MARTIAEVQRDLTAADEGIAGIATEARGVYVAAGLDLATATAADFMAASGRMTPGQREANARFRAGTEKLLGQRDRLRAELIAAEATDLEARRDLVRQRFEAGGYAEGPVPDGSFVGSPTPINRGIPMLDYAASSPDQLRAAAFAAIERIPSPSAQNRLDAILRAETAPAHARYLAAVGSDAYRSAFIQVMRNPERAALEMLPAERQALVEGRQASDFLAAMTTGGSGGAAGGYALPVLLDPTIILTNDGASNPLRAISRTETIVQKSKRLVTSAGVSAAYGAEGSSVALVDPVLGQPEITAQRATAFVKLSYELFGDWTDATSEIARIFADAKDNLEAEMFLHGSGSDEPQGLISGLVPFAAAPADPDDLREAQNDLGPRFQGNARWLTDLATINTITTFVATADAAEPAIFDAAGNLLRKPVVEASYAAGNVVYGDFRQGFAIVDRIGLTVELVPHTFDATTGLPDGHRGLLAIWRSGSDVIVPGALRLLGTGS